MGLCRGVPAQERQEHVLKHGRIVKRRGQHQPMDTRSGQGEGRLGGGSGPGAGTGCGSEGQILAPTPHPISHLWAAQIYINRWRRSE